MSFFSPSFIRNAVQRTLHLWERHFDIIFRKLATRSVLHKTFFTILLESVKMYFLLITTQALKTILKSGFFWGGEK